MLERIKDFFRDKIEKVAEQIYWRKYKRDEMERYRGGFSVSIEAQQVLDYIIRWAGKKDPIERFLNAVREVGFEFPVSIQKAKVCENTPEGFKIVVSLFEGPDVFLEVSERVSIMELRHNQRVERKLVYSTFSWNLCNYEYETSRGTHIKRGNWTITINGILNKTENYEFTVEAATDPHVTGKYLYLQVKEMAETIESALKQNNSACYVQKQKVYPIYKIIDDSISPIYRKNDCKVSISALGVSAVFFGGKLVRYEQKNKRISIVPYAGYIQKEFHTENGKKVAFENKQYKIANVQLEEVKDILQQAKNAFDKIESLDF